MTLRDKGKHNLSWIWTQNLLAETGRAHVGEMHARFSTSVSDFGAPRTSPSLFLDFYLSALSMLLTRSDASLNQCAAGFGRVLQGESSTSRARTEAALSPTEEAPPHSPTCLSTTPSQIMVLMAVRRERVDA